MFFNSIRWRLQIWYGIILLVLLVGFGFTAFRLEVGRQFQGIDDELRRRANELMKARNFPPRGAGLDEPSLRNRPPGFGPDNIPPEEMDGPGGERPPLRLREGGFQLPPRLAGLFEESETNGFYCVIWGLDGRELARSTNAPAVEFAMAFPPRGGTGGQPGRPDQSPLQRGPGSRLMGPGRTRGVFREMRFTPRGEIILVGRSIQSEIADLHRTAWELAGVGSIILLLGLAGGWWLASRAIRPVEEISGTALKISAGDLSQRINIAETKSELGRLASVLNSTFARLESAFAQQQQFASDAAHELRTPVTVMLTQTQTSLNRERSAAEYREAVEACQRSAQRMRRLIESLLELARLDAGQETMKRSRFDLARVAADCLELVRSLATERGITLQTEFSTAECLGDSERIGQVITNLLTNAVHYNKEAGEIRVATKRDGEFVMVEVADNGPGIAPEHLPKIFHRFYRADSARRAAQGRSGLGLAISKAIVEAHGGSIEVSSEVGKGATFRVRLPVG